MTCTSTPAIAVPISPQTLAVTFMARRQLPSSTNAGRPSSTEGTSPPTARAVRSTSRGPGTPRLVKLRIGQPRFTAISRRRAFGLIGRGLPTMSSSGRSSSTVAVEVAPVEIDVASGRELARVRRLAVAVARGLQHRARERSVPHLETRAKHVRDTEVAGERIDLVAGRRGHDRYRVLSFDVRLHEGARLGVDVRRESLAKDPLGHRREFRLRHAPQRPVVRATNEEKPI